MIPRPRIPSCSTYMVGREPALCEENIADEVHVFMPFVQKNLSPCRCPAALYSSSQPGPFEYDQLPRSDAAQTLLGFPSLENDQALALSCALPPESCPLFSATFLACWTSRIRPSTCTRGSSGCRLTLREIGRPTLQSRNPGLRGKSVRMLDGCIPKGSAKVFTP